MPRRQQTRGIAARRVCGVDGDDHAAPLVRPAFEKGRANAMGRAVALALMGYAIHGLDDPVRSLRRAIRSDALGPLNTRPSNSA